MYNDDEIEILNELAMDTCGVCFADLTPEEQDDICRYAEEEGLL